MKGHTGRYCGETVAGMGDDSTIGYWTVVILVVMYVLMVSHCSGILDGGTVYGVVYGVMYRIVYGVVYGVVCRFMSALHCNLLLIYSKDFLFQSYFREFFLGCTIGSLSPLPPFTTGFGLFLGFFMEKKYLQISI